MTAVAKPNDIRSIIATVLQDCVSILCVCDWLYVRVLSLVSDECAFHYFALCGFISFILVSRSLRESSSVINLFSGTMSARVDPSV